MLEYKWQPSTFATAPIAFTIMTSMPETATLATRRRRAPMACRNCRCERCTRKGLHCEYVAVGDETPPSSPSHSSGYTGYNQDSAQLPPFGNHSRHHSQTLPTTPGSVPFTVTGMPHPQSWTAQTPTSAPYSGFNTTSPPYGYHQQAGSIMPQNNANAGYAQSSSPSFNHMQTYGGYTVPHQQSGNQGMPGPPYHSSTLTYDYGGRR
ncbi:c6 finger domain [Moniliophthora roreri]|nr:c6 finger domain [Moniliophthora roreri]